MSTETKCIDTAGIHLMSHNRIACLLRSIVPLLILLALTWPGSGQAAEAVESAGGSGDAISVGAGVTNPGTAKAVTGRSPVSLGAGESLVLPVSDAVRVAVAEPRIADVTVVSRTEVLLTGRMPGETTLHIWDKDGLRSLSIEVLENTTRVVKEIETRIGLPGVKAWMRQGTVVLEGVADSVSEKQRAAQVASAYGKVVDLVTVRVVEAPQVPESTVVVEPVVDPMVQDALVREKLVELASLINDQNVRLRMVSDTLLIDGSLANVQAQERAKRLAALYFPQVLDVSQVRGQSSTDDPELANRISAAINRPGLVVRPAGNRIVLEGTLRDQNELTRALNIAGGYGKEVMNMVSLSDPLQVALKVHVLEVDRTGMGELGVTWGSMNRGVLDPNAFYIGEVDLWTLPQRLALIGAKIQTMVDDGHARILAAPTLLTMSGETAQFLAGGEIPVAMPQGDNKYVIEWKEYGVRLQAKPVVDLSGNITVSITPEVSTLDWANAIRISTITLPALRTRRTQTQVRVEDGVTLVLGGLINREESKQVGKMPWLSEIPVLGMLFRSEKFSNGETELLFLVTPFLQRDGKTLAPEAVISPDGLPLDSAVGRGQAKKPAADGDDSSVLDMAPQSVLKQRP